MGRGAGGGVSKMPPDTGEAPRTSPRPDTPRPVEQAVVTEVFRNSRRDGLCIGTSEGRWKRSVPGQSFLVGAASETRSWTGRKGEAEPQRNLFRSIFGSHVSRDFSVSSHDTSSPV